MIRQDPVNPDLLFLGTEFGLYMSIDGGDHWLRFSGNVPKASVRDMQIQERENDLVIGTHGRGIMIIDDITPIRKLKPGMLDQELVYLGSRPYQIGYLGYEQGWTGDDEFAGPNPPGSVNITYYLKKRHIFGDMFIEVYDPEGKMIKKLPAGKRKGINRVQWQMRKDPPKVPSSVQILGQAFTGPAYPPGEYTIKIHKGENIFEGEVKIEYDPNLPHSKEDRDLRLKALMKTYDLLEELAFIDAKLLDLLKQLNAKKSETDQENLKTELNEMSEELMEFRKGLLATREGRITGEKRLRERLGKIYGDVMGYQGRPTDSQIQRLQNLDDKVMEVNSKLAQLIQEQLELINQKLRETSIPEINLISRKKFEEEAN
ncbi:MAG: hypothetical protein K9J24_08235 [Bacteroidales bacterium]|nr:hypothetical protein [Bacteroidales bacterium]